MGENKRWFKFHTWKRTSPRTHLRTYWNDPLGRDSVSLRGAIGRRAFILIVRVRPTTV